MEVPAKLNFKFSMVSVLSCLLGMVFWFPSVSILNIGNGTSVQLAIVISIILIIILMVENRITISFNVSAWFCILILILVVQALFIINEYHEITMYLKGLAFFSLSFYMMLSGYLLVKYPRYIKSFFKGYVFGGVFSSLWAIMQVVFWEYLKVDLPFLVGIQNSASFSKTIDGSYFEMARGFAFTPESSILFMLLCPCFAIILYKNKINLKFFIILLGIYTTKSMGIFIVLPIILIYILFLKGLLTKKVVLVISLAFSISMALFLFNAFSNVNTQNVSYSAEITERFSNLSNNSSFISRSNSIIAAYNLLMEKPFMGWGVQSDPLIYELNRNSTIIEKNIGINSFIFNVIVSFGLLFSIILFIPTIKILFQPGSKQNELRLFIICTLLPAIFSLSYYNIYHVWFALGMAAIVFDSKSKSNLFVIKAEIN